MVLPASALSGRERAHPGVFTVAERVGAVEDLLDQIGDRVGAQVPARLWDELDERLAAARAAVADQPAG